MSFKSEYTTINIAAEQVREAIKNVAERHGWDVVEDNKERAEPVMVRAHERDTTVYDMVLVNPETDTSKAYDIGCLVTDDNSCDIVFDRYRNSVHDAWGNEANGLYTEVIAESIYLKHNSQIRAEDFESFVSTYGTAYKLDENGEKIEDSVVEANLQYMHDEEYAIDIFSKDCPVAALEC